MRIALIDDQKEDLQYLNNSIKEWAAGNAVPLIPAPEIFSSGEAFLAQFEKNKYDIIFLDIYMNGMTGMEAARQIRTMDEDCHIIFTTSSTEFAVESYEVDSSYYLVKPFSQVKLSQALSRCKATILEQEQFITVPCAKGELPVRLHSVIYSEFTNRKIIVHFTDNTQAFVLMTQKEWMNILLKYPYFCDCVRGIIVNLEHVEKLLEDRFLMCNGIDLPISRLKYREVREQFLRFNYTQAREGRKSL